MTASISLIGRSFTAIAFIEAATWAGLLIGMFLKYVTDTTEAGVQTFGPIHGAAFMLYVVIAITAAIRLRWPWKVTAIALIAAIPPLVTIRLDMWLRSTGRLDRPEPAARIVTSDTSDSIRTSRLPR